MTVQLKIEDTDTGWAVVCDTRGIPDPVRQFFVEEIMMSGIRLGEALSDRPHLFRDCSLAYPTPPYAALYAKFLSCPVSFNAAQTRANLRTPTLDTALRGYDPEFNEICLHHCGQIMRQIAGKSSIVAQLRSLFLGHPGNIPSLADAAGYLGLSSRSLRRHLLQEGTSYQSLIDLFRLDLAKEYLKSEYLTTKEIGYLLGFKDASAFRRAFKSWTGLTIQQFRAEHDVMERVRKFHPS
jgi:AraC-like DNA-binding protein